MTSLRIIAALFFISAITICACQEGPLDDVSLITEKEKQPEKDCNPIKDVFSKVGKVIKDAASSVKSKVIEVKDTIKDTIKEKVKSIKDEHHKRIELHHQQKSGKKDTGSERKPIVPTEVEHPTAKEDPGAISGDGFGDTQSPVEPDANPAIDPRLEIATGANNQEDPHSEIATGTSNQDQGIPAVAVPADVTEFVDESQTQSLLF